MRGAKQSSVSTNGCSTSVSRCFQTSIWNTHGQIAKNVYTSLCQNGVGITKGTIGGILAADMACDIDNPLIDDMLKLGSPTELPPRPFLDIGVRARFAWELWRARGEV
jgi:hypothetical protein